MSLEQIEKQVNEFLKRDIAEVFAIRGAWGVGKTYSWNKFLKSAKEKKNISLEKYSYVSLFGINSLDSLKRTIFENAVSKDVLDTEADISTFKKNASDLIEKTGRNWVLSVSRGIPTLKNFYPAIESLAFLSLNKMLICIDDLERRGNGLDVKDVLGLISFLKEQRKCKIVLLLNDGEDGLDDFLKHREKVIDIDLKYKLTAEEAVNIAYDGDDFVSKKLRQLAEKLEITNIRILKKIERLARLACSYLEEYEQEVAEQALHTLTLYSYCFYCEKTGAPPLDFVQKLGYRLWGVGKDENESDEIKGWKATLLRYGYNLTDELDSVLAEAVRTGYFVEDSFRQEATKMNSRVIAAKSQNSFTNAWKTYHDSFADNRDEVVGTLYESFKLNVKYISVVNLNGAVTLLRELGETQKASELIDFYINQRGQEANLFDLKHGHNLENISDSELIDKFNAKHLSMVCIESAEQVLERISDQNGWGAEDETILANTSAEEFYQLFKTMRGQKLSSYINKCLRFGQYTNSTEQQIKIAENVTEALKMIAQESDINRRRVRKYGIDISEAA